MYHFYPGKTKQIFKWHVAALIAWLVVCSPANGQTINTITALSFDAGGVAVKANGDIIVLDWTNGLVYIFDAADPQTFTSYTTLSKPGAVARDPQGNAYITHQNGENRVAVISNSGISSLLSAYSPLVNPEYRSIAVVSYGLYTYLYIGTEDQYIVQVDITNIASPVTTAINLPELSSAAMIAIDKDGNFYIAESYSGGSVWKGVPNRNPVTGQITSIGQMSVITNISSNTSITEGSAASTDYIAVNAMATDAFGNLYFSTFDGYIARISNGYMYTVTTDNLGNPLKNIAVDASANIYFTDQQQLLKKIDAVVSTLPLTWVSFSVSKQNQSAIVSWSTATEQNTKDFTVQHGVDGKNWKTKGVVTAAGSSNGLRKYSYTDNNPGKGYSYYRIVQTDLDGRTSFSAVRMINLAGDNAVFTIAGNRISNGMLRIQVQQAGAISLYDLSGKLLWEKQFAAGLQSVDVSMYNKGIYLLRAKEGAQRILIQ